MTSPVPGSIRTLHHDFDERPFIVIWEVTRACALACAHCRAEAQPTRHPLELTTDEGRALLDDLASYGPPRPMVVLTGGDPVERPDLSELVAHGTDLGLSVSIAPSVTPRLTRAALAELRLAGAKACSLSLDGATAASHDGFRGVDGVFRSTLATAEAVRSVGLRLQINTTVTADTVDELPAILARVLELDAGLWSVFFLVSTGRGAGIRALGPGEVEEVLHWLHEVGRYVPVKATEAPHFRRIALQRAAVQDPESAFPPGPLRLRLRAMTDALLDPPSLPTRSARPPIDVNAGRGFAFVDHLGRVYPSGFLPVAAGSIRMDSFPSIYRDSPLFTALRTPRRLRGRCGRCEYQAVCGGSRSAAYAATGDPLGQDPNCTHVPGAPVDISSA